MTRRVVGIDLGTSHTVVASCPLPRPGERPAPPAVFPIPQLVSPHTAEPRSLLPSCLFAPAADEPPTDRWGGPPWIVGEHARRRGREVPGRAVTSAKSWLAHAAVDRTAAILPWGLEPEDPLPRVSPVAASARVLEHVRLAWDAEHPEAPLARQAVILTVPASFDPIARELTLRAAAQAGLSVRLLEEPQAAFYDYLARHGTEALAALARDRGEASVLVCDVGGGTTDLTLIRAALDARGALDLRRVAVGRHLLLGGDNMDLALAHHVERRLLPDGQHLDPRRFAALVLACRGAKEALLDPAGPA
ncbi:MAG TPA: Hsp70 family protein, partial [Polyangiaceae bacterium]|nr:Hsp70 family protein [Polyangiaceae bacterium]